VDDIQLLKLKHQGYCCTRIMVIMVLDMWGEQNPALVKGPVSEISLDGLADGLIVFLQNFFDGVDKGQP